ncbi:MAG TPA: hypothetical protein VGM67_11185 [Gemmatimonadaceae bacterium]
MGTKYVRREGWDLVGHVALVPVFLALAVFIAASAAEAGGPLLGLIVFCINAAGIGAGVGSKGYWHRREDASQTERG